MADQNPQQQSILEFSTNLGERRRVTIDGESYEIINLDEFSLTETARLRRFGERLRAFFAGELEDDLGADKDLDATVDRTIERVLMAPPEVRARLSATQKLQLLNAVFRPPARIE